MPTTKLARTDTATSATEISRPNLLHITKIYFRPNGFSAGAEEVINTGWCMTWAWLAHLHYPAALLCTTTDDGDWDSHAFIWLDGRFYDSERPRGVRSHLDLPWFKDRWSGDPHTYVMHVGMPSPVFKQFWSRRARIGVWDHPRTGINMKPWPEEIP